MSNNTYTIHPLYGSKLALEQDYNAAIQCCIFMDFRYQGKKTLDALDLFDKIILEAGGKLYPAKDSRMAAATFQRMYPQWQQCKQFIDPTFSSQF